MTNITQLNFPCDDSDQLLLVLGVVRCLCCFFFIEATRPINPVCHRNQVFMTPHTRHQRKTVKTNANNVARVRQICHLIPSCTPFSVSCSNTRNSYKHTNKYSKSGCLDCSTSCARMLQLFFLFQQNTTDDDPYTVLLAAERRPSSRCVIVFCLVVCMLWHVYQCAQIKIEGTHTHTQPTTRCINNNISEGMTYEHVKNLFV